MDQDAIVKALMGTWPVKMGQDIVQGLMAPGNAYQSTPENPVTTEQMIAPAANLSGVISGGSYMAPAMKDATGMGIRAYHGSPYDFEKFDISKIGTGEGAQVYGHGLYFAENENVANQYRKQLAGTQHGDAGAIAAHHLNLNKGDVEAAIAELQAGITPRWTPEARSVTEDAIRLLQSGKIDKGKMYEVNINAEPGQFLNWDKPLSQQPQAIQPLLDKSGVAPTADLGSAISYLRSRGMPLEGAANDLGIPGIRYLDQGSRAAQQGTSNYVVFNPNIVDITKKWAIPGTLAAAMGDQLMQPSVQQ